VLWYLFLLIVLASATGFWFNRRTAVNLHRGGVRLHSIPVFHGAYALAMTALPAMVFVLLWQVIEPSVIEALALASVPADLRAGLGAGELSLLKSEIRSVAGGTVFGNPAPHVIAAGERLASLRGIARMALAVCVAAILFGGLVLARRMVSAEFRARQAVERVLSGLMFFCALVAVLTTIGIVSALVWESLRFFARVPLSEFLFGLNWEPQIPIREDQQALAGAGAFGWLPVFLGTLVVTTIALVVAIPIGLFTAIYLNEFASKTVRRIAKPLLEILAGVPTVVYGFFAILVVAPALRGLGADIGIAVSPNTALAAGSVMGIMLIPFISSFADDALSAVPRSLRDGSLALGATQGETVMKVLFPAAIPGIVGGILLAVSRAIGETMIVVMAAGLTASLTINPLNSVTTVTVQIVTLLIGDTSFDNPKTLAAFALGLMLFIVTLALNVVALRVVRKYRELYD